MKSLLLINGGLRIGDTFHMIPYIYNHQDYEITWITGTYELPAVKFIQQNYPNIKEIITYEDGLPMFREDRIKFNYKVKLTQEYIDSFDKFENNIDLSLDLNPTIWASNIEYLPKIQAESVAPYICLQADSISKWKQILSVNKYLSAIPAVTIGCKGEQVLPGTTDKTGLTLQESAQIIKNSVLYIGIHSSMSCLNLYLNHPGIVLHFTKNLLKFGDYNKKIIDILP